MGVNPNLLRRSPLFKGLSRADVKAVADLVTTGWFDRGDYLYRQGSRAEALYWVFDGAVKLSRVTEQGKGLVIDFRGPGSVFGARAVVAAEPHADDARAMEDALVAVLPVAQATDLLTSRPAVAIPLARHLAAQLVLSEAKVVSLATRRVHQRLGEAILELASSLGVALGEVTVINARLTQSEIAAWIGTTRETTSALLNKLRRAGFIGIENRRIHVRDITALETYVSLAVLPDNLSELLTASTTGAAPTMA